MSTALECQVCFDTKRQSFQCTFCKTAFCFSCFDRWREDKKNVSCPSCRSTYDPATLQETMPKQWLKKWLKWAQVVCVQENRIEVETLKRIRSKEAKVEEETWKFHDFVLKYGDGPEHSEEIQRLFENIEKAKKMTFVVCPSPNCEEYISFCKGVVETCISCKKTWCGTCRQESPPGHACDENIVKEIEEIGKMTKNCPRCFVSVSKVEGGCDQMWCTQCKTAWSWEHETIEHEQVHNPHFFEDMFKSPTRPMPPVILENIFHNWDFEDTDSMFMNTWDNNVQKTHVKINLVYLMITFEHILDNIEKHFSVTHRQDGHNHELLSKRVSDRLWEYRVKEGYAKILCKNFVCNRIIPYFDNFDKRAACIVLWLNNSKNESVSEGWSKWLVEEIHLIYTKVVVPMLSDIETALSGSVFTKRVQNSVLKDMQWPQLEKYYMVHKKYIEFAQK